MSEKISITLAGLALAAFAFGGGSSQPARFTPPPGPKLIEIIRVLDNQRKVRGLIDPTSITIIFDEFRESCPDTGCARIQVQSESFVDHWWISSSAVKMAEKVSPFNPLIKVLLDGEDEPLPIFFSIASIKAIGPSPVLSTSRRPRAKIYTKNGGEFILRDSLVSVRSMLPHVPDVSSFFMN